MPDEETLKDLGFPDGYPKWYRDAMRRANNKGSSRLAAAKSKGRINKSKAREESVLPLRSKVSNKIFT